MLQEKFAMLDSKCLHTIKFALQHIDHALQQPDSINNYAIQDRLMIIGESVNNLSLDFKSEFSTMPWDVLKKIRTDMSHWFFCLDTSLLIQCIRQDIVLLLKIVDNIEANDISAKKEPISVELARVVEDTKKKARAYEQKRSRHTSEAFEDIYHIKFLNKIIEELNNIDSFIGDRAKNITSLTRYALEMSLTIISLCIKKHISAELLSAHPLNLSVNSFGMQGTTINLTWVHLQSVKKMFMHYSHTFKNESIKNTALSCLRMKTHIYEMLMATEQQCSQKLTKEYFYYSAKNMLSGINDLFREFPRPWPETWSIHQNTETFVKELNKERAQRMKIEGLQNSTPTLITSFFYSSSQWLIFIIHTYREKPTHAHIRYLNLVKGQHKSLPLDVKIALLSVYYKAKIREIDLVLLQKNSSLPKFIKSHGMESTKTLPNMLSEQEILNHYYNTDLRDYAVSLLPVKGTTLILPQTGIFFKVAQEIKTALLKETIGNNNNNRLLLAANINAYAWVLLIVEHNNDSFKPTKVWYIVSSMSDAQSLPKSFISVINKVFPQTEIKMIPLLHTASVEYGKVVVKNIKVILENRVDLITGEIKIEQKNETATINLESEKLATKEKTYLTNSGELPFLNPKKRKRKEERLDQMELIKSDDEEYEQKESSSNTDKNESHSYRFRK